MNVHEYQAKELLRRYKAMSPSMSSSGSDGTVNAVVSDATETSGSRNRSVQFVVQLFDWHLLRAIWHH